MCYFRAAVTWHFTWINAKGFSLLLIRAASCWRSSSTIAENMTGAITGELAGDAADQGLQEKTKTPKKTQTLRQHQGQHNTQ